jgi:broad specificity phosphatase PhoE
VRACVRMVAEKVAALRALSVPGLPRFRVAAPEAAGPVQHLYLIRHGEATHNVAPRPWGDELLDARLTPLGEEQAAALRASAAALPLELIVVSPLSRAIATALIGLAPHVQRSVPCVAVEACREQLGQNVPDRRRRASEVAADFPQVDLAAIAEDDALFTPTREPLPALAARADAFLEWVAARPEAHVAVVTHSSFLAALCNVALDTAAEPAAGEWFGNAEMRHIRLVR